MSSLRKNISANLLSNLWSTGLSLILTPVYVQVLGVESYGLIGFYLSWLAILGILDTGLSATAVREIAWMRARPDRAAEIAPLMRSLEVVYWAILIVAGAVLLSAAWWLGERWFHTASLSPDTVRGALVLMALSLVVQVPSGLYVGGLMGLQRQVEGSGLLALFGTLRGVLALGALWLVAPDVRIFFASQIVASVLQTGTMRWAFWRLARGACGVARFERARLDSVKSFAGGMVIVTALGVATNQADKLILSKAVSLESLGAYMLAWAVASGLSRVTTPLAQALNPRFAELVSRGDTGALVRQVRLAEQLMNVLVLPPAAVLGLMARPILNAWVGVPSLAQAAAPSLVLLTVGTALTACSFPALSALYGSRRIDAILLVSVTSAAVLLPALLLAVRAYGVIGAASAWALYGLVVYVAYTASWFRSVGRWTVAATARDFGVPCATSLVVALLFRHALESVSSRVALASGVGAALVISWGAALVCSPSLRSVTLDRLRWPTNVTP